MGQKTVRFSDLSGQLMMDGDAPARIVVCEHPELGDGPVEIEALAAEARAIEQEAVEVAIVELFLPGEDQPAGWPWRPRRSTGWPPTSRCANC